MEELTKNEKQRELDQFHVLLLATFEYLNENSKDQPGLREYFQNLAEEEGQLYKGEQLETLKNWFLELINWPEENGDPNFWEYIREKTGYGVLNNGFERKSVEDFVIS